MFCLKKAYRKTDGMSINFRHTVYSDSLFPGLLAKSGAMLHPSGFVGSWRKWVET
jgi:hypothetical protein